MCWQGYILFSELIDFVCVQVSAPFVCALWVVFFGNVFLWWPGGPIGFESQRLKPADVDIFTDSI